MVITTDSALWYSVGIFGKAGYAVPNCGQDPVSLNERIPELFDLVNRNQFDIMHHEDADLRTPPSLNTLMRIHKLYVRAGQILAGNAVPPGRLNMESSHAQPNGAVFKVYPCPYFLVRNPFLKRWSGFIYMALTEMAQHTENRKAIEFSTDFAGLIGQYFKRIYVNMAVELFGKTYDLASADGFLLQDVDFAAYNPSKFFTGTEMVDIVPPLQYVFTETMLQELSQGINYTDLPDLQPWPGNPIAVSAAARAAGLAATEEATGVKLNEVAASGGSSTQAQVAPIIPPAPGP